MKQLKHTTRIGPFMEKTTIHLNFISEMKKTEHHIHLEGSVKLKTLKKIARRKEMALPGNDFYPKDGYPDFESFTLVFDRVLAHFTTREDFFDLGYDFAEGQASQNIIYTEAFLMPQVHEMMGRDLKEILTGLEQGLAKGEKDFGATIRLVYSISRMAGSKAAWTTLDYIDRYPNTRVVGIDLAGMEVPDSILPFKEPFETARQMGLTTTAHAGEFSGADHVSQTLDILKPSRIGHGIGCRGDETLIRRLVEENIPLDISLSSNVLLKAVTCLEDHPVRSLFDQGVSISLNTDDPALFNTSLVDEYEILSSRFAFTPEEISRLAGNALVFKTLP